MASATSWLNHRSWLVFAVSPARRCRQKQNITNQNRPSPLHEPHNTTYLFPRKPHACGRTCSKNPIILYALNAFSNPKCSDFSRHCIRGASFLGVCFLTWWGSSYGVVSCDEILELASSMGLQCPLDQNFPCPPLLWPPWPPPSSASSKRACRTQYIADTFNILMRARRPWASWGAPWHRNDSAVYMDAMLVLFCYHRSGTANGKEEEEGRRMVDLGRVWGGRRVGQDCFFMCFSPKKKNSSIIGVANSSFFFFFFFALKSGKLSSKIL